MSELKSNYRIQSEQNQTTIILILKDRHSFTSRWIDHFLFTKCSYNLLVADGSRDSRCKEIFENRVPSSKYIYLGPDISTSQYLAKIDHALSLVETKFVMFSSNDDFISYQNIPLLEDFLQKNNEYVSVIGKVFDIGLSETINSGFSRISYAQPHQDQLSLEADTLEKRVFLQIRNPSAGWHSLVRKESISNSYKLVINSNIRNFEYIVYLADLIMCCYGKIKVIDSITTLLHEVHGDQEAYNLVPFVVRAVDSTWIQEIHACSEILSLLIESEDGVWIDPDYIKSKFFEWEKCREAKKNHNKFSNFFIRLKHKIHFELSKISRTKKLTRIDIPVEYRQELVNLEEFLLASD